MLHEYLVSGRESSANDYCIPSAALDDCRLDARIETQSPLTIDYCSALAGAGKTRALIRRACRMALDDHWVLIVMPTKELITASVRDELLTCPTVPFYRVIDGDTITDDQSVTEAITEHLKIDPGCGQVLFITHQAFSLVRHWHWKERWDVMIDEESQVTRCHHHADIAHTHCHVTDHVRAVPCDDVPGYARLLVQDHDALTVVIRNPGGDATYGKLGDLARDLASPHWEKYVDMREYRTLIEERGFEEPHTLTVHSILSPDAFRGFRSVLVVGALLEHGLMHRLWEKRGVRFRPDAELAGGLRYTKHENGPLVTIRHATERHWSRGLREGAHAGIRNDARLIERWVRLSAGAIARGETIAYQANRDVEHCEVLAAVMRTLGNAGDGVRRVPNLPHGLNDFADAHRVLYASATNPTPNQYRFLLAYGLSAEEIRVATYYMPAYQGVMRISIRDPDDATPKDVLVPDRGLAQWLAELFPGCRVRELDAGIRGSKTRGRPPTGRAKSARERMREMRARRKSRSHDGNTTVQP